MKVPVAIYTITIALMGWLALENVLATGISIRWLAAAGALVFIFSDATLAWNRFLRPVTNAPVWILSSYYGAQLLIALSAGNY